MDKKVWILIVEGNVMDCRMMTDTEAQDANEIAKWATDGNGYWEKAVFANRPWIK